MGVAPWVLAFRPRMKNLPYDECVMSEQLKIPRVFHLARRGRVGSEIILCAEGIRFLRSLFSYSLQGNLR